MIFDIQDVGARFYTYIWTMYDAMIAAGQRGLRFVILDRPNPVGGRAARAAAGRRLHLRRRQGRDRPAARDDRRRAGPLLQRRAAAGGRQGDGRRPRRDQVEGWRTDELFADTGLPWILPSPNMPTPHTALLYPGTCLFEATNLSEGRGTTKPFELIGAPYVDHRWAADLNRARAARRAVPGGLLHPDLLQARRRGLRWRPGARRSTRRDRRDRGRRPTC